MSQPVAFRCARCGGKAVRVNKSARYCLGCSVERDAERGHSARRKAQDKARRCAETPEAQRELMRAWGFA